MKLQIKVTKQDIKKGKPTDSECPVAIAFRRAIPVATDISIGDLIYWTHDDTYWTFKAPKSVLNFIESFDAGKTVCPFEFWISRHKVKRC